MSPTMTAPSELRSGNPALSEKFIDTELLSGVTADRTMSAVGVSAKTLVLLAFVVAGGAWGWTSATQEFPTELGAGYADTTLIHICWRCTSTNGLVDGRIGVLHRGLRAASVLQEVPVRIEHGEGP